MGIGYLFVRHIVHAISSHVVFGIGQFAGNLYGLTTIHRADEQLSGFIVVGGFTAA